MRVITVRMPDNVHAALAAKSESTDVSVNTICLRAILPALQLPLETANALQEEIEQFASKRHPFNRSRT